VCNHPSAATITSPWTRKLRSYCLKNSWLEGLRRSWEIRKTIDNSFNSDVTIFIRNNAPRKIIQGLCSRGSVGELWRFKREEVTNHELIFRGTRILRLFKDVVAQAIGQVKRELKI
jgi:hypothetical protein